MANIQCPGHSLILDGKPNGANTYVLADVSDGYVGTMAISFWNKAAFSGTLTVQCRTRQTQAVTDGAPFQACNYVKIFVNGLLSDQTYGGVVITTDSHILVPASGMQIALLVTYVSGDGRLYWTPATGSAA